MAKSEPLRSFEDIEKIKRYFYERNRIRDYALFTLGINIALRIGDLLKLTWDDVYNFDTKEFRSHIVIKEQKTSKKNTVALNLNARSALEDLKNSNISIKKDDYVFQSRLKRKRPIHRSRAYNIIKEAAKANCIEGVICCHSMRKTFGYHAWKHGVSPAVIMEIYNHSSIEITRLYLSIDQDDKDQVFNKLLL